MDDDDDDDEGTLRVQKKKKTTTTTTTVLFFVSGDGLLLRFSKVAVEESLDIIIIIASRHGENAGAGEPLAGEKSRHVASASHGRQEERGAQVEKARVAKPVVRAGERRGHEHETREGDATSEGLERPDDEDWTRTFESAKEGGERSAGVSVENERHRHQTTGRSRRRGQEDDFVRVF